MDFSILTGAEEYGTARPISFTTALLFAFTLGFYLYTLQPSLAWGDGTKLQMEAFTGQSFILADLQDDRFEHDTLPFARLGVAAWDHPLYVMASHTLVQMFPSAHPPWLINMISAFFGAGAIAVFFLICSASTQSYTASLLASLSVAVSHTFWFHAVTPEVYTLFAFLLLLSFYLFDRFERSGHYSSLFLSLLVLGLSASNHLLTFLAIPALLIYRVFHRDARTTTTLPPLRLLGAGLAFAIGFSPFLVQLTRMLKVFPVAEVFGPVIGSVFLRETFLMSPQLFLMSLGTYLMFLAFQFNPLALVVGGYGFLHGKQISSTLWLKALGFYGVFTLFGLLYRVTDQFAFFLTSHLFFGVFIALGIARLIPRFPASKHRGFLVILGLLTISMPFLYSLTPSIAPMLGITDQTLGIPEIGTGIRDGFAYYVNPNKRGDRGAYHFGQEFFARAPKDALIIAEWYTDTDEFFVLGYFSTVEGIRPDIEIAGWPMEDPFSFDADLAIRLIEDQVVHRPVYLASLSEKFYRASYLAKDYCIVPELNLYRVYPTSATGQLPPETKCLTTAGS
jgi:hypothetical protein